MKLKLVSILAVLIFLGSTGLVMAQNAITLPDRLPAEKFYIAKVLEVLKDEIKEYDGLKLEYQTLKVKISKGDERGKELEIKFGGDGLIPDYQKIKSGDKVTIVKTEIEGITNYFIIDRYRLPYLALILGLFFALVIFFSRFKGLASIFGLVISILVLVKFLVPRILNGGDPLIIGLVGAFIIAILSIYTAHGLNKRTSVALVSTILTLVISAILAISFVYLAKLFGGGSEEAFFLQTGQFGKINLRGLLLAGIIIGALGVLDDITTSQTAAIDEIKKANPNLSFQELYKSGLSVGREHIASLVNTLVLAYAGASLPLFILFSTNKTQPLWVVLNSEFIAEEVIRTLVGSTSLVLAVPISTFLASYFFSKKYKN